MVVTHPRRGLSFFERRDLEKQFSEQVPEYSFYAKKKLSLEKNKYLVSTALGVAVGFMGYKRYIL
jgi:hypothetical protein